MRRLLIAFMIILLPLRGWVGDAMATQMAAPALTQQVASSASETAHDHASGMAPHMHSAVPQNDTAAEKVADCAGHAGSEHSSPADASHCQSCVACQVCHTVALTVSASVPAEPATAPVQSQFAVSCFTSAERALSLKPPIS